MVTFLIAFSFECFGSTSKVAVFTSAAGWIAVFFLVIWTIYTGWEGGETSVWEQVKERWARPLPIPHEVWDRIFPEQVRERIFPKRLRERVARPFANARANARAAHERRCRPPTSVHEVNAEREKKWWSCFTPRPTSHTSDPPSAETQVDGLPL